MALGAGEGVAIAAGVGVTAGNAFLTVTPLLQVKLLPFLMQVNFFPPKVTASPFFWHLAPGLTAAIAETFELKNKQAINRVARARFTP